MQIDISLDVFKALAARLSYDGQSYDDILRELLAIDSPIEPEFQQLAPTSSTVSEQLERHRHMLEGSFFSRGLSLPHGSHLRARYKGQEYRALISQGHWIDVNGIEHSSPSAAATAITGNNVNGLRFWDCWRPGDTGWRKLDALVSKSK